MVVKNLTILLLLVVASAMTLGDKSSERGPDPPKLTPTGCRSLHCHLLSYLGDRFACCVAAKDRRTALIDFASKLVEECGTSQHSLDECIGKATLHLLDDACFCLIREELSESLRAHVRDSVMPVLSNDLPLNVEDGYPNTPGGNPIARELASGRDLSDYECSDKRLEGTLCSAWNDNSLTAGNTRCRDGHYCASHGYGYKWCYIDLSNNWDYCCSDTCGYHGENYRWCWSINRWEYCGEYPSGAGTHNVIGQKCMELIGNCGKHGYYNYKYWCEHDYAGNWHYCCAPYEYCSSRSCYINDQATTKKNCV